MLNIGKTGAICFALWGLLHIFGGGAILWALQGGPDAGFALYRGSGAGHDELSGRILGYFAFNLVWMAGLVVLIALRFNWRNSETALALNTGIVLLVEAGLMLFLLRPGHVSLAEAAPGMILFVAAATLSGIACNTTSQAKEAKS